MTSAENHVLSSHTAWDSRDDPRMISNDQLALIEFANRLGSSIWNNEPGIADERNVRREAELLMSLLSSTPKQVVNYDSENCSTSDKYSSSSDSSSSTHRSRESFSFICPSLSLERSSYSSNSYENNRSPASSSSNSNSPPPPPAVLLGRALKVDDRDAFRLSADAMARNLLLSFQKAVDWRIQAWTHSLSASLVRKEMKLKQLGASENELKQLVISSEARLLLKLREVANDIDVLQASTSFQVLPQRVQRNDEGSPPLKKRKVEEDDIGLQPESEYQYNVAHALSFEGVINFHTPAGYCEIGLSVPGTIEGTFSSADPGAEELTAVHVEVNTRILASMVERSCRTIVRSAVEHAFNAEEKKASESSREETKPVSSAPPRDFASPTPGLSTNLSGNAAIVTPRVKSPPAYDSDKIHTLDRPMLLPIPDDLDGRRKKRQSPRMISPQLHSDMGTVSFTPSTPLQSEPIAAQPSLVSPPPSSKRALDRSENGFTLGPRSSSLTLGRRSNGPNLPVLVEVACAAMRES